MTAIVLKNFSVAREVFVNKIFMFLVNLFASIGNSIQVSRQIEANRQIAKHLLPEYPEHTYESLVAELNHKTIQKEM